MPKIGLTTLCRLQTSTTVSPPCELCLICSSQTSRFNEDG
jgi:hypothetical protein